MSKNEVIHRAVTDWELKCLVAGRKVLKPSLLDMSAEIPNNQTQEDGLKALVVEDESDMITLISYHLNKAGIQTTAAKDGEHGLKLALQRSFDLIILDLMLPLVSGIEICRQLKLRHKEQSPPVILVTAVSENIVEGLLARLDVADVVFKPFRPEAFMEKVKRLTEQVPEPANSSAA